MLFFPLDIVGPGGCAACVSRFAVGHSTLDGRGGGHQAAQVGPLCLVR